MPERQKQLENWLSNTCGLQNFDIKPASGDASFRRYFRISLDDGTTQIAMDAPPEKESCDSFVAIGRMLRELGLNVPEILQQDMTNGFLLLGDLGQTLYLDVLEEDNVERHYDDALSALMVMQATCDPTGLPAYDHALLMREMELFREWLLKQKQAVELHDEDNRVLDDVFDILAANALEQPQVCVHRDYHSRNLMVVPEGSGMPAPGILDFQDAVAGPITYDLVSLIKDCYIKWPREKVLEWARGYAERCVQSGLLQPEQKERFVRWFDLMGVQRHLKASGIFARLSIRDGKHGYLDDIPRTLSYITELKNVYPELEGLIKLIERYF
jgi:aminoglycoside/choline kinase family phosphotransferase